MTWRRGGAFAIGRVVAVGSLVVAADGRVQQSWAPSTDITIIVRPVRETGGEVERIDVRAEIRGPLSSNGSFSLTAPITYASVQGIANRVDSLQARDSAGPVPLTVVDDVENRGGYPYYRHWRATRNVVAPVIVTYRMRPFSGVPRGGPQFDLYAHGGGISTGGMALFVVPEGLGTVVAHVRWDLAQLATGSLAASTYGEGNLDLTGTVDRIIQAYYMAGPIGRYSPAATSGFRAYWLGETLFDAAEEMAWGYRAYEDLRRFYGDTSVAAYRVFVRAIPGVARVLGGTALQNSFMVGVPAGRRDTSQGPRNTIAHEMGHMWVGGLSGDDEGAGATWFAEGLNVFYTRLLLMRAGLTSIDEYGRDINSSARAYYTNPFRNASADSLSRLGFSAGVGAGSAQNVPYARGSLFFADVDARIRAASGGTRRLDDVVLPLLVQRRHGVPLTATMLIDAIAKEIGPSARADFDAIVIRGKTIAPVTNAFGPCFERRARTDTVDGMSVESFEWERVTSIPVVRCRAW